MAKSPAAHRRLRNESVLPDLIDTILWGRKTYDWGLAYHKKAGMKGGMFDTKLANYVFSRKPPETPDAWSGICVGAGEGVCAAVCVPRRENTSG